MLWTGPTLHGPQRPYYVTDHHGNPPKPRLRLIRPLSFIWKQNDLGEWYQDESAYFPMVYPVSEDSIRIELAKEKRQKKA